MKSPGTAGNDPRATPSDMAATMRANVALSTAVARYGTCVNPPRAEMYQYIAVASEASSADSR